MQRILFLALLITLTIGCTAYSTPASTVAPAASAAPASAQGTAGGPSALETTTWGLESFGTANSPQPQIAGSAITLTFSSTDRRVSGSAGCNEYFAEYTLQGNQLQIGLPGVTRKLCRAPQGIMEQEQHFLAALEKVASYQVQGEHLELRADGGKTVLLFRAAQ